MPSLPVNPAFGDQKLDRRSQFNVADPKIMAKILPLVDQLIVKGIADDPRLIAKGLVGEPRFSSSESNLRDSGITLGAEEGMMRPSHLVVEVEDPSEGEEKDEKQQCRPLPFF